MPFTFLMFKIESNRWRGASVFSVNTVLVQIQFDIVNVLETVQT